MLGTFTLELNTTIYSVQGLDIKSYLHIAANNSAIAPLYLVLIRRNQHQSIKPHNWFCKKTYMIHDTCSFASGFSNVHEFREREKRSIRHTKSIPMQISVMRKEN